MKKESVFKITMATLVNTGLLDITGMIPCATANASPAAEQTVRAAQYIAAGGGYVAIPLNSLSYTGIQGAHWQPNAVDVSPEKGYVLAQTANDVGGGSAGATFQRDFPDYRASSTGSFQNFMRAIHETANDYTNVGLTGDNALKYWGESQGNYSIYDQTALTRTYTTNLYYALDDSQGGKNSTEIS